MWRPRSGPARGGLLLAVVLICLGCSAASAQAYVYWANTEAGTIARANLDGTGVDPNFITGADAPDGVAVDEAKAKVRFTFASDQAGARFRCALDKGKFKPCASPAIYRVKPGRHRFRVEALDSAGADPTPAHLSFKVVRHKRRGKASMKARK